MNSTRARTFLLTLVRLVNDEKLGKVHQAFEAYTTALIEALPNIAAILEKAEEFAQEVPEMKGKAQEALG